jgi:O-antigen ligase
VFFLELLLLYGVIMSGSRGVMLGILASLMFILIPALLKKQNKETVSLVSRMNILKFISLLFLVSIIIIYILFLEHFPFYKGRISSIINIGEDVNFKARVDLWKELIRYLKLNPMGYGTGSLGGATYKYGTVVGEFKIAENQYLEIAIEYGVIGLVSVLSIFLMIPILYLRVFKLDRSGVLLSATLATVIIVVSGIVAPSLEAYPGNLFFGALLGAFSSLYSNG